MRLLILFITLVLSCPAMAQDACSADNQSPCLAATDGYERVFERLAEATGKQNEYHLSALPAGQFLVHVFRDGIELSSGSDYKVDGQRIQLYGKDIVSRGGTYQAAYFVPTTTSRRMGKGAREITTAPASRRVLETYLRRSLSTELGLQDGTDFAGTDHDLLVKSAPAMDDEFAYGKTIVPAVSRQAKRDRTNDEEPEPESLRMLDSILASRSMRVRSTRHKKMSDSASAQGLEGVGDAVASPFDRMSFTSTRTESAYAALPLTQQAPASLRMLKQIRQGQ